MLMNVDTLWLKNADPDNDTVTEISGQSYEHSGSTDPPEQV